MGRIFNLDLDVHLYHIFSIGNSKVFMQYVIVPSGIVASARNTPWFLEEMIAHNIPGENFMYYVFYILFSTIVYISVDISLLISHLLVGFFSTIDEDNLANTLFLITNWQAYRRRPKLMALSNNTR